MRKVCKVLAIVLVLVSVFSLCACGGGKYVGTWTCTKLVSMGQEFNPADLGAEFSIEIKSDGTFSLMENADENDVEVGTWKESSGGISMTVDGDTIEAKMSGSTLILEEDGSELHFEKK